MTCPYGNSSDDVCRERRRQRRMLSHRNLWAPCGRCGRVLAPRAKEAPVKKTGGKGCTRRVSGGTGGPVTRAERPESCGRTSRLASVQARPALKSPPRASIPVAATIPLERKEKAPRPQKPAPVTLKQAVVEPFWRPKGFTRHNEIRRGWPKGVSRNSGLAFVVQGREQYAD